MARYYSDDARNDAAIDDYLRELALEGIDHNDFQEWLDESGWRYTRPPIGLPEAIAYYQEDRPQTA